MKATFALPGSVDRITTALKAITEPHEVIIRPKRKDRSTAQNRLYWEWLTLLAGETGQDKESLHEEMKRRHLVPIFRRDDSEYGEMIKAVLKVAEGPDLDAIRRQVVRLTSTTKCSVEQFTEYLNAVEGTALELGCILPHPEDLYWEAMGIKRN